MRRVQVESPFAPRTPLIQIAHDHADIASASEAYKCALCRCIETRGEELRLHKRYLALCLRDCIERGETPYASHAILTLPGVLRDDVPEERERGIAAGFAMRRGMDATAIYVDCYSDEWNSRGMLAGEADARMLMTTIGNGPAHAVEIRYLRTLTRLWVPVEYKAA